MIMIDDDGGGDRYDDDVNDGDVNVTNGNDDDR